MPAKAQSLTQDQLDTGWALFEIGMSGLVEIQRDDELGIFACDEDAVAHVERMAKQGSERHQEALARHKADAPQLNRAQ
ncbi:hypothetical protein VQ574_20955 (plasmid) [Stutzerimonas frequens]|uniref:hypothetical protein n=1 Tax=Stutzerimonas frequens TaxID=2968969 RepID=UPI002DB88785|nr:hypothetical protein [Stutzerimonas frequens]WRW29408.1 hypothetical protein VQ574_20955 [Stutzerimonas frequens]